MTARTTRAVMAAVAMIGLAACSNTNTQATRALDRAVGTDTSGAYPAQRDGTRANPPGTAAERALDRAAGTNTSGAYPAQSDGRGNNPPGTAVQRAYDRTTGSDTSGAYPQNRPSTTGY